MPHLGPPASPSPPLRHDPRDEHHVLRMYDFFYHREHLFLVCELLRDNLCETRPRCSRDVAGDRPRCFGTTCAFDPAATPHSRLFPPPPRLRRYEFSRFNRDSGGERYFQLPRLRRIAKQCLEALVFVHR